MHCSDASCRGHTSTLMARLRCGLQHRAICLVPGIGLAAWFTVRALSSGSALDLVPVVASLVLAGVCFSAPMIMTEGWTKPFPPASHLALISKRAQRLLSVVGIACLSLPALVRLVGSQ